MNFIKLTTLILLLPLSSFSQSKNLEINDFFDFKMTRFYDHDNVDYAEFLNDYVFTDSTFFVPEGKLWKINYFSLGFKSDVYYWNTIGEFLPIDNNVALYLDGGLLIQNGYEKKCPFWLNSGEHQIIVFHNFGNTFNWEMKLNLSIVEFNITEY